MRRYNYWKLPLLLLVVTPPALAAYGDCSKKLLATGDTYIWTKPLLGLLPGETIAHDVHVYSVAGCKAVCGMHTPEPYPWEKISTTLTTWILPAASLLLQAPFENNNFRGTMLYFIRLIGSPVAVLTCTLWNIRVTSRCAFLLDRSFPCPLPRAEREKSSTFHQLRDSFYLLSVMNQYTVAASIPADELHRVVRMALFDTDAEAVRKRDELATYFRRQRRRGVVQIFLGLLWFATAFAISIGAAFGTLGENATAHDLALGLSLAWLPVTITSTMTDRNPTDAPYIMHELNTFLAFSQREKAAEVSCEKGPVSPRATVSVHEAPFPSPGRIPVYAANEVAVPSPSWSPTSSPLERPVHACNGAPVPTPLRFPTRVPTPASSYSSPPPTPIFRSFAGQGRLRWHYGLAHDFLSALEAQFPADHNWASLYTSSGFTTSIVYIPFAGRRQRRYLGMFEFDLKLQLVTALLLICCSFFGAAWISFSTPTIGLGCRSGGYMIYTILCVASALGEFFTSPSVARRHRTEEFRGVLFWFMTGLDTIIATTLCAIIFAQTVGFYNTCHCRASMWTTWSGAGGYVDFDGIEFWLKFGVKEAWTAGTAVGATAMTVGMGYLLWEWGSQSFLWTYDRRKAVDGLETTRAVKWVLSRPQVFVVSAARKVLESDPTHKYVLPEGGGGV